MVPCIVVKFKGGSLLDPVLKINVETIYLN